MAKNKVSKKTKIVATTAALLLGGSAAYAYWSTTGSGAATAETGGTVPVIVNQASTVSDLAPGLAPQTLGGNFDNPNDGPVYVAGVTAVVSGTDKSGCTASDYTIAGTAAVGTQVAAGEDKGAWTGLTIQFNNKATNQDACKGATVTITYTAS